MAPCVKSTPAGRDALHRRGLACGRRMKDTVPCQPLASGRMFWARGVGVGGDPHRLLGRWPTRTPSLASGARPTGMGAGSIRSDAARRSDAVAGPRSPHRPDCERNSHEWRPLTRPHGKGSGSGWPRFARTALAVGTRGPVQRRRCSPGLFSEDSKWYPGSASVLRLVSSFSRWDPQHTGRDLRSALSGEGVRPQPLRRPEPGTSRLRSCPA